MKCLNCQEVLTPDPRDQAIELAREALENLKEYLGDLTYSSHPESPRISQVMIDPALTAIDNLLKGQK